MPALADLRAQRAELYDQMTALMTDEHGNPTTELTDDDKVAFDEIEGQIVKLDGQIARVDRLTRLKGQQAKPAKVPERGDHDDDERDDDDLEKRQHGGLQASQHARFHARPKQHDAPGTAFARITKCLAASRGNHREAADLATKWYGPESTRIANALGASDGSAGGFLVPDEFSEEIIELLRKRTVVRGLPGIRTVPMNGSLLMPIHSAGVSGSYIGENTNIGKEEPTFGQHRMTEKKLAVLVPLSNDLLRLSSPSADMVVRDDIVRGLAVTEDANFLRGAGTANAPKGIRFWASSTTGTAGTTAANIQTDVKAALNALADANVDMSDAAWIMAPRSRNHLAFLRDTGQLVFPSVTSDNSLSGLPIRQSNQVPTNLGGGGDETELYLVAGDEAVIGESTGIVVDASDTAAYHDGTQVVAAYSQDQTVIRAIARHDFMLRHTESAHIITGITWGA